MLYPSLSVSLSLRARAIVCVTLSEPVLAAQVRARQQALNRTDTMAQAKPKRLALLSMLFLLASEVVDCGSDVVVYLNTVRPASQRAIISAVISEGFVSAYFVMLVLSLLVRGRTLSHTLTLSRGPH
eukprot:COSAG03_NODE_8135_length_833_cov_1.713896_1_plen_127_part_00